MSELGDVLELLHGAAGRVTTLTATLLDWHDEQRALRAVEAAQHHGAAIAVLQHQGEPPRQYEQRTLVHYRHLGRYRLHRQANAYVHQPHDVLQVCDGEREWTYLAAERQAYVQAPSQQHELFRLLDPSWLPATCTLSVAGHTAHEDRRAVELHGQPRPDLLDRHLHHLGVGAGQADELHAVVDAATGLLLSVTSASRASPTTSSGSRTWPSTSCWTTSCFTSPRRKASASMTCWRTSAAERRSSGDRCAFGCTCSAGGSATASTEVASGEAPPNRRPMTCVE
jgi:hypothetical protein